MTLPRVLVLENGRLAEDGNPHVLAQKPDGAFIRLLSSTNDPAAHNAAHSNHNMENSTRKALSRV